MPINRRETNRCPNIQHKTLHDPKCIRQVLPNAGESVRCRCRGTLLCARHLRNNPVIAVARIGWWIDAFGHPLRRPRALAVWRTLKVTAAVALVDALSFLACRAFS